MIIKNKTNKGHQVKENSWICEILNIISPIRKQTEWGQYRRIDYYSKPYVNKINIETFTHAFSKVQIDL